MIVNSGNYYLGALKGNQSKLLEDVETHFVAQQCHTDINQGHGRWEKRVVSICTQLDNIKSWPGLHTLIRVEGERRFKIGGYEHHSTETRYCAASFIEPAAAIAGQIRGYWGVEKRCDPARVSRARERAPRHKVHYVRDVTQGKDVSRIRMHQLPQIFAEARNFALNIFRDNGFNKLVQAQRCCQFGLDALKRLFRMK